MNLFPVKYKREVILTNQITFINVLKLRTAKTIYSTKNSHFFVGNVESKRFKIKFRKSNPRNNYFQIKGEIIKSKLTVQTITPTLFIIMLGVWLLTMSVFFIYIDKAWFMIPALLIITIFWYVINIIIAIIFKKNAIHIIESIMRIAKESNELVS